MTQTFTPHDYQREAMLHLFKHKRSALWMPMGGGKTVTTLTALEHLSMVDEVYPALVLAPLRVARSTWPDEIAKWGHLSHLTVSVITGTPAQRQAALDTRADIYTMNYDNLVWLQNYLGDDWPFKTVVADEFTRLKSFRLRQGSKRAAALGKVAHSHVDRFIGLTGTPAPNGVKDLWGQIWFLDKGARLGRTFSAFEQRWFRKGYDGYSLVPYEHTQSEVEERLKDICLTVQALSVEEPNTLPVYIDLPPKARKAYESLEEEMYAILQENEVEAANAAVRTQKCLQMANGAIYVDEDKTWEEVHDAKLDALESIIEEANGAPVLVAYNFKHDLQRLQARFRNARVLDADPDTIRKWNEGKISILLAHPACLHPSTEVLTESRGWVKIIDVASDERVFDGVEFVSHSGCSFSGVKVVTELFGVTMTPDHKLLIGGVWVEAKNVRDTESSRREALYTYEGDDAYLSAMLPLRNKASNCAAARAACQQAKAPTLSVLHRGDISSHDGHPLLADMEGYEGPSDGPEQPRLPTLRWRWARHIRGLANLRKLLQGYVCPVQGRSDDRADRQHAGIQQAELPVGLEHGATSQQDEQQAAAVSRPRHTLGRVLSLGGRKPGGDNPKVEQGYDGGTGASRLSSVAVPKKTQVSEVYDLVDCGPRSRFVVRNADGDVFISHNSAGHGLNLADGGNILAFFGVNWNLEEHMQIIERIGPMRQKQAGYDRPVMVYPILARDTVDDVVMERLQSKKSVQEVLLEAMKRRKK